MKVLSPPRLVSHGPPHAIVVLGALAKLPRQDQRLLWRCLAAATWSTAEDFKARLLLFDAHRHTPERVDRFIIEELGPHAVVRVIEALCEEGVMTRLDANRMQNQVLRWTDEAGQWRE